jgi:hypothetical protein
MRLTANAILNDPIKRGDSTCNWNYPTVIGCTEIRSHEIRKELTSALLVPKLPATTFLLIVVTFAKVGLPAHCLTAYLRYLAVPKTYQPPVLRSQDFSNS